MIAKNVTGYSIFTGNLMMNESVVQLKDKLEDINGMDKGELKELYKNVLTKQGNFNDFIAELQRVLKELKIGILRVEKSNMEKLSFTLTVAEDLDCSGIPVCDEQICTYDEGFIAGILHEYTGKNFHVKEVDCWGSGDRVCRFEVNLIES